MNTRTQTNISIATNPRIAKTVDKSKNQENNHAPIPEGKTYSLDEVYQKGLAKLSTYYGVDIRKLE